MMIGNEFEWRLLIQMLVVNYAADFLVLGGAVYAYNRVRDWWRSRKISDKVFSGEEGDKLLQIIEKAFKDNPKEAKVFVSALEERIAKVVQAEVAEATNSFFENTEKEIKKLKKALTTINEDYAHAVSSAMDSLLEQAKEHRKAALGEYAVEKNATVETGIGEKEDAGAQLANQERGGERQRHAPRLSR